MGLRNTNFLGLMNFVVGNAYRNCANGDVIIVKQIPAARYGNITLVCETGKVVEVKAENGGHWKECSLEEAKAELL